MDNKYSILREPLVLGNKSIAEVTNDIAKPLEKNHQNFGGFVF